MRNSYARLLTTLLCAGTLLLGQAPKQMKPKSEKERQAIMAIQAAADPDARIAAADNLLSKFADTDFKIYALQAQAYSAREKGDIEQMTVYAERLLEADPQNYTAMLLIAGGLAQRTREFDLDKEEKLTKATKFANDAMAALKTATPPNPQMTPEQWEAGKKDFESEAHEALGNVALVRKKYDVASTEFKMAGDLSSQPNPTVMARLVQAYNQGGKYTEVVAEADKVLAMPNLNPQIKQFVQNQKDFASKMSATKK